MLTAVVVLLAVVSETGVPIALWVLRDKRIKPFSLAMWSVVSFHVSVWALAAFAIAAINK